MELRTPAPALLRAPRRGQNDILDASELDIDLDRVVYDPAYRRLIRDQLNRAARRKPAEHG